MTDTEIETMSTLFMWLICTVVIGGTVGWWMFLRAFHVVDSCLQNREFRKRGWQKITDESGTVWYVGYGD